MKVQILDEVFSIENTSSSQTKANVFLEIYERNNVCRIYKGRGSFKCLQIDTLYNSGESGTLLRVTELFSKVDISIFAFTSINHGYFFFEEKFQNLVETSILAKI